MARRGKDQCLGGLVLYQRPLMFTRPLRPFVRPAQAGIHAFFYGKSEAWMTRLRAP
jgi:hypothetical protein